MSVPAISVILPAYNAATYIRQSIQSVLDQHFTDFELLVINDGSTDQTETEVLAFDDNRIRYYANEGNKGLIFSLNRGIELARGHYIARLDADDICLPHRLEKQKQYLDTHPGIDLVSCLIAWIDAAGEPLGHPPMDTAFITQQAIRKRLPYENCITHPSVMVRGTILKTYQYRQYQKNIEDYDLWLRLQNGGHQMAKLPEILLLYRVHQESITTIHLKRKNFFFIHFQMKRKFLAHELYALRVNFFTLRVIISALADLVKGVAKSIKRGIKG